MVLACTLTCVLTKVVTHILTESTVIELDTMHIFYSDKYGTIGTNTNLELGFGTDIDMILACILT